MKSTYLKKAGWTFVILFAFMNVIAVFHAYKFTHFTTANIEKPKDAAKLASAGEKISALVTGVSIPRPVNKYVPSQPFETIHIQSNKMLECWKIKTDGIAKGTVIMFHGYCAQKSAMIDRSDEFLKLGYNTVLVDFMGSGGSEGEQTTIGFLEAEEVNSAFNYLSKKGEQNIFLFGSSMGAVAIMKAVSDYGIHPKGIIIECPFGTMYETVCARFRTMHAPIFPMAGLLVFWGGLENNFWAFAHNPVDYARNISCPTLLLYGAKDDKVSRQEIDRIFANLGGKKELHIYENAGHENYLRRDKTKWLSDVSQWLMVND